MGGSVTTLESVCLLFNISKDANSAEPIYTAELDLHCLLKRLQNVSADNKNIRLFKICAFRINTYEASVYAVRTFMKCTHGCAAQKAY